MNRWKRRLRFGGLGVCAAAVLVTATGCGLFPKEEKTLPPPLAKPVEIQLDTAPVKRGGIVKTVQGTGTFESTKHTYQQFTEADLRVKSVNVLSGDKVHEGQVLIQLQNHGMALNLKEQQMTYDQALLDYQESIKSMDIAHQHIKKEAVEIARMKLDQLKQEIDSRTLKAATDGVVTFVMNLRPGDIAPAYEPVVGISDPTHLRVAVDSSNGSDVTVGMKTEIDFNGKTYGGTVVQTPMSAPYTTDKRLAAEYEKTLYIKPDKPIPDAGIGNYADIRIIVRVKKDTLIIPRSGLRIYSGREYVQILDGSSRKEIDVQVGLQTSTEVEILKGLKVGQKVILQ